MRIDKGGLLLGVVAIALNGPLLLFGRHPLLAAVGLTLGLFGTAMSVWADIRIDRAKRDAQSAREHEKEQSSR